MRGIGLKKAESVALQLKRLTLTKRLVCDNHQRSLVMKFV